MLTSCHITRPGISTHTTRNNRSLRLPSSPFRTPPHRHNTTQRVNIWPLDQAWGTSLDLETLNQTLPQNLFAISIVPYAGFLYHLTKGKQLPGMTVFGFYFLLVFVFATIPAGIYAKTVYHTALANVDWLHGSAESLLTVTNLLIVVGLRKAIREVEEAKSLTDDDEQPPLSSE